LPPGTEWCAQQVGHPPRLLHLCRSRLPFPRGGEFSTCRMRAFTAAAMRRWDGKASVARRFRLATWDGMVRTTSRTSSSSPPPLPISASLPPWRRVFNLPNAGIYCCGDAPLGRQSFRRSEIPTCHLGRNGAHNKSDILLVSSTFADPGFPSPVAASFQLAECAFTAAAMRRWDGKASVARRFRLATRDGMVRTTSRTSSSSPPPLPISASLPPWRRVFNLPNAGIYCCGDATSCTAKLPSLGDSDSATWDGMVQHNKSDILLVSSTFERSRRRGMGSPVVSPWTSPSAVGSADEVLLPIPARLRLLRRIPCEAAAVGVCGY
jgi:hypothetical protein